MKRVLVESSLVLLLVSAAFSHVHATETPSIGLYFDKALTQRHHDMCPSAPPGSVLDTLYVAIEGFSMPVEGIEYSIPFPPEIVWIGSIGSEIGIEIGDPISGVSIAFFTPLVASGRVVVQELLIIWMCEECMTTNILIEFAAHPATGSLRAVTSELAFQDVVGLSSVVCGTLPGDDPVGTADTSPAVPADYSAQQCVLDCPAGDGGVILPGDPPGEHHTPDLDNDGVVAIVDLSLFIIPYVDAFDPDMDYYCSGNIDLRDFVLFTRHWLHTGPVPVESTTWGGIKALFLD